MKVARVNVIVGKNCKFLTVCLLIGYTVDNTVAHFSNFKSVRTFYLIVLTF